MILSGLNLSGRVKANTIMPTDPFFNDVSILLHGEGANNSTTFIDSSSNNYTLTSFNTPFISTSQFRYGTSSIRFDSSNDRVVYSTAVSQFALASSSVFTLEASVFITADSPQSDNGNRSASLANSNFGALLPSNAWWWIIGGSTSTTGTNMQYSTWDGGSTQRRVTWDFPSTLNKNQWYDLAIVRDGSNWYGFLNGVSLGAPSTNQILGTTQTQGTGSLRIGSTPWSAYSSTLFGYIDEYRITKGVARYTSNYTPTGPFPDN